MVGHKAFALLVLGLCLQVTQAANILAIFTFTSKSPFILVAPYMRALVRNGHQITIVSQLKYMDEIEGARHIRVPMLDQLMEDLLNFDYEGSFPTTKWGEAVLFSQIFRNASHYTLSDSRVQGLLRDPNVHFDMVILQASHIDALYGFAQHFNAPLVGVSAFGTTWNIDYLAGNKAPSVYEPMVPEGYSNGFSLLDKFYNWVYITEEWLVERLVYLPHQVYLYKHFFNQPAESLYNIRRNFSLVLINHHFSLGRARSNMPNVIEVAGMHMNQSKVELEPSLQRFLDEAKHGVIYFSMGMEIIPHWLPQQMLQALRQSFDQLPWHVVWKFEQKSTNKSKRIYMSPLLPQREILSHPNVKLFITHGGLLSIIEAAYNAVPMLCLPMYYDQFGNAERMKHAGVAKILNLQSMTPESTTQAIKELIENPMFAHNAKQMSMRLRDQPMNPLETAVWWTEYVLRHKGAPHMRISDQDMSFMQYYSLDIASVLLVRIGLAIIIIACISLRLLKLLKPMHIRQYHVHMLS
ncbi:hypothetical protein ACLKA7_009880 [Drosophila subpalustris]